MKAVKTSQELFERALTLHRSGKPKEAEQFYRKVIARNAHHDRALFGLSVILLESGNLEDAKRYLERAVEVEPVVTLSGDSALQRAGASIAPNLGLPELIAHTEDEFVEIAVELGRNLVRLGQLRQELRARLEASPVGATAQCARDLEAAYRGAWRRYCAQSV